jgi:AraC family transcriptional regulator
VIHPNFLLYSRLRLEFPGVDCVWSGPAVEIIAPRRQTIAGTTRLARPATQPLGVCYDAPNVTPPDRIRYDARIPVDGSVQPKGDIGVQEIGPGDHAVVTHRGPYEKLSETYVWFCGQWLPTSGRELRSAPSLEFYRNSPQPTAREDLITDMHMPLEPRS